MFFPRLKRKKSVRSRLALAAQPDGVQVLAALFARSRLSPDIDAEQFRIDFKDRREAINQLTRRQFILTAWDPAERYRLSLVALPLIESNAARSILAIVDRVLRYLSAQYEARRGQKITLAQMSADLGIPEKSAAEALRYLIDTPVTGPRKSDRPESAEWWIQPSEKLLDYPNLNSLLLQLTEWSTREEQTIRHSPLAHAPLHPQATGRSPPSPYELIIQRIKNHWVLAILMVVVSTIFFLASGLDAIFSVFEWIGTAR